VTNKTGKWPTLRENRLIEDETLVAPPAPPAPPPVGGVPPEPGVPPPDRRIGLGMLLGLAFLVVLALGILLAWYLTHRDDGPSVTTVVTTAAAAPQTPATSSTSTAPRAGAKVTMPSLVGKPVAAATAELRSRGLTATRTEVTSSKPAGTVVDQAPEAGAKVSKGANVTLSVAKAPASTGGAATTTSSSQQTTTAGTTTGATTTTSAATTTAAPPPHPASVTVPDLSGQDETAAAQSLWKNDIFPSFVFVPGDDPLGTVEDQARQSGSTVAWHAHVQVNLSRGPGSKASEQVPSVIGKTLRDAISTLNATNLRLIYLRLPVTDRSQAGKIVQQTPLGGATAPRNAQVLVFLASYGTQ
jgi:beta-lactam-binding protein with PASTA domain